MISLSFKMKKYGYNIYNNQKKNGGIRRKKERGQSDGVTGKNQKYTYGRYKNYW